ncbi:MAG: 3-deoxy-D-manno-octulosonic acid transferase [Candidatus Krumholzibacteriota bacterium]
MFRVAIFIYSAITLILRPFLKLAGFFSDKLKARAEATAKIRERWAAKSEQLKGSGKRIWFHVSSLGEFLQAEPVISLLSEDESGKMEITLTFSSPSGIDNFSKFLDGGDSGNISFVDYLPLDTPSNARFCLEMLKPDLIVYVKYDLWPNLILETSRQGIPQILISGGLSSSSGRYSSAPARWFYGKLYSAMTFISASTEQDAERFRESSPEATVVTGGDTKYDQVHLRVSSPGGPAVSPRLPAARDYLIAGSTWPGDEDLLLRGFTGLIEGFENLTLVIAPHEPTEERVAEIIRSSEKLSLDCVTISEMDNAVSSPIIIADGIGYLAELYRSGILAYVGGGFSSGVHNVLEPAVLGIPVMFGPGIDNSHEAGELKEIGSGMVVESPEDFEETAASLLSDRNELRRRGQKGREYIDSHLGASERYRDMIIDLIR